jgi:hypothetical protein
MWSCPHYDAGRYPVFLRRMPPLKTAAKIGNGNRVNFALKIGHLAHALSLSLAATELEWRAKKGCAARGGRRVAAHE